MKEIKAIVQPFKLPKIRSALRNIQEFPGMSVDKIQGCGPTMPGVAGQDIKQELTDFSPKTRIEIVAPDHLVDEIVRTITEAAYTGQIGDGLVWVTPVEYMIRIQQKADMTS
ncbi:MAG: P-II family nitrogen regulator [Gammaproteobacteria bacterium]|nr:P-II family nitrogen regulator [Gammaproteobacteria bacterium]